jgi:hypothetical protein
MGPDAPRVHLLAVETWPGEVVEVNGRHGRHHGEVAVGAPGVDVEGSVVVGGPSVVLSGPSVVLGGPSVVVGGPTVVGGGGVVVAEPGRGHDHDRDHGDHGGHPHGH